MDERREHSRQPVEWPIRLWLNEQSSIAGHAVNASAHGTWVYLSWLPLDLLKPGTPVRLDVHPGTPEELTCTAVVRRVGRGIGVETQEPLPVDP